MQNNGLVSICLLAYNHEKFISDCINSLKEQSYKNFELIAIDDGSSDRTYDELKKNEKLISQNSKIITQKNTGNIPHNLNKLFSKASGEYCYVMSADDLFQKNSLEKLVGILNSDINIQFCAGDIYEKVNQNGDKSGVILKLPIYKKNHLNTSVKDLLELEFNSFNSFFLQNCLFRKSIIKAIGGCDEDMIGEDIVLRIKVFRYMLNNPEMTFRIINEPLFYYRHHENNLHKNFERQIETVYQVQKKYGNGIRPESFMPWSIHSIEYYLKKIDFFISHDCNKKNKKLLSDHIAQHFCKVFYKELSITIILFWLKIFLKNKLPFLVNIKKKLIKIFLSN